MYVNLHSELQTKFCHIFRKPMVWNDEKDELLCREIFAVNVFCGTKRSTVARGAKWEKVAENLNNLNHVYFKVDKRGVRDRYNILARDLRRKNRDEEKASGIDTELTDLEKALEDLIEREDAVESEQRAADDQKKQDKENAAEMRNRAMETFGQSKKRKEPEGNENEERKLKKRSNGNATVAYLKEKNERMEKIQKEELELKRLQLEKEENFMKLMMTQQQQQQKQLQEFQAMLSMQAKQQNDLVLALVTKLVNKN